MEIAAKSGRKEKLIASTFSSIMDISQSSPARAARFVKAR